MPLDPRVVPILELQDVTGSDEVAEPTLPARRIAGILRARELGPRAIDRGPEARIEERMVPVHGGAIRVRLYSPGADGAAARPLHVFLHGGGWCLGDVERRDPRCVAVAFGAGCVVASVDYRMAPENAYPVPLEDCYSALSWLVAHAPELGVDAARVSIGGESAGANLAAASTLLARHRGGPHLVFQWLDVPVTDLTMSSPSIDRLGAGYGLTKSDMQRFAAAYLRDVDPQDPYASPLHARDLTGLPPALIMTSEFDPLRDEGRAYVERLRAAGVEVEHHDLQGLPHVGFSLTGLLPSAKRYEDAAIAALKRRYET